MPIIRQTSFLTGALDPLFWGRTDLRMYAHGLRTAKNLICDRSGSIHRRPGSRFIAEAKTASSYIRLIPYVYSDTVSYVLEVGDEYIRFYSGGVRVEVASVPVELVAPWAGADLAKLQWAQVGAELVVTHQDYAPRRIVRDDAGVFAIYEFPAYPPPRLWVHVEDQMDATEEPRLVDSPAGYLFTPTATVLAAPWVWYVTRIISEDATGILHETLPERVVEWYDGASSATATTLTDADNIVLGPTHPVTIRRAETATSGPAPGGFSVVGFNYYRGKGSNDVGPRAGSFLVGFVGHTTGLDFIDDGREPNYGLQPRVPEEAGAPYIYSVTLGYPSAVTHIDDRRVWGGIPSSPLTLFTSALADWYNFDKYTLTWPGMPLEFELAARRRERIRSLVSLDSLFVFTDSSVWAVAGSGGMPMDYDNVRTRIIDEVGSTYLAPLVVDGRVLFSRAKGIGVRMLKASPEANAVTAHDVSLHAANLFQVESASPGILDWTYAEDPDGLIWAVVAFQLVSGTPSGETVGWMQQETAGLVFSVASVPEGDEDVVYQAVQRAGYPVIERMESRKSSRVSGPGSVLIRGGTLDSAVAATKTPGASHTFTGLDHLDGEDVYLYSPGNPVAGPVEVVAGSATFAVDLVANIDPGSGGPVAVCFVGLPYTAELETLDAPTGDAGTRQKQVVSVGFEVLSSLGLWVGQDFDHLVEWRQRAVSSGYDGVSAATELVKVQVSGKWGPSARAVVRVTDPVPVTILGVSREVDVGG